MYFVAITTAFITKQTITATITVSESESTPSCDDLSVSVIYSIYNKRSWKLKKSNRIIENLTTIN
jgi:hypothetical protein